MVLICLLIMYMQETLCQCQRENVVDKDHKSERVSEFNLMHDNWQQSKHSVWSRGQ